MWCLLVHLVFKYKKNGFGLTDLLMLGGNALWSSVLKSCKKMLKQYKSEMDFHVRDPCSWKAMVAFPLQVFGQSGHNPPPPPPIRLTTML